PMISLRTVPGSSTSRPQRNDRTASPCPSRANLTNSDRQLVSKKVQLLKSEARPRRASSAHSRTTRFTALPCCILVNTLPYLQRHTPGLSRGRRPPAGVQKLDITPVGDCQHR